MHRPLLEPLIRMTGGSGGRRENSVLVNHLAFWVFHKRQFFAGFFGGVGYGVACTLSLLIAICNLRSLQTLLHVPGGESLLLVKKQIHLLNILFCVAVFLLAWLPPEAFVTPCTRPISICDGGLGFQMKCPHLCALGFGFELK